MKKRWFLIIAVAVLLGGCKKAESGSVRLDPNNPVTVTVWHYYNGAQKVAFDKMVEQFNETAGNEQGIFVESHNQGDVSQLEESVMASIEKKVGSEEMPNIFASYADTAYAIEKKGYLIDLEQYMTDEEIGEYVDSYIEEGRIGSGGELKIFPTAKSSEIFMLNKTDWDTFAQAAGASLDDLKTKEGLVDTARKYYEWTDSLTPDIPNDGMAFYGRDAMANLFIIGSMQLGQEIFHVANQKVTLNVDKEVMRRIWDFYYIPYIKGYFAAYGKFRSDDVKTGKIIALTGSTTSAIYFPDTVEEKTKSYPIESLSLPVPVFEGGGDYAVQQGAGMVVTKSTPAIEYACVEFLKWFTEETRNLEFCSISGYLPVKKEANSKELLDQVIEEKNLDVNKKVYTTVVNGYEITQKYKLYTNKAFDGGSDARKILEYNMIDLAAADREAVLESLKTGISLEEAVAPYETDAYFEAWFQQFSDKLKEAAQ